MVLVSDATVIFHIIYFSHQTHCPHSIPECNAECETTAIRPISTVRVRPPITWSFAVFKES